MAIDELKNRTKYFAKRGMLHSIEKIKTPVIINGIEVGGKKVSPVDGLLENLFRREGQHPVF